MYIIFAALIMIVSTKSCAIDKYLSFGTEKVLN